VLIVVAEIVRKLEILTKACSLEVSASGGILSRQGRTQIGG
jgi:hypothetical protein